MAGRSMCRRAHPGVCDRCAAERGYDLRDYVHGGCVGHWWGFAWMILAEARGVLTPEKRAAAWCRHGRGRGGRQRAGLDSSCYVLNDP
jgi:hypothetical protein